MRNGSKKIQLIRCPIDNPNLGADQWNMPLDLIVIGSSVNSDCSVEILDGTLIGLEGILKKIDPSSDCVGLTYTALSSKSLKIIASTAKSNGSFIIIGGQPAMASAESLVLEDFIDAVCVGDGEPTMKAISNQIGNNSFHKELIPNLLFKSHNGVERSHVEFADIWNQQIVDRTLGGLNLENYFRNYPATNTLINMRGNRAANIFSKRGCTHHCSFCARQDKKFRLRNPIIVANEIFKLVNDYKVDYILDTCDTWVDNDWGRMFSMELEKYQIDKIGMMVFADARDITWESVEIMRSCGIDSVLLGIESGSERVLRRNSKRMTRELIVNAVDILVEYGIKVSCSFVLGQLDEDDDSLIETIDLTEILHTRPGVICYGNVIIPLRGSKLWAEAFPANKIWPSFITNAIDYDMDLARELFIAQNTNITGGLKTLEHACEVILKPNKLPIKEYAR